MKKILKRTLLILVGLIVAILVVGGAVRLLQDDIPKRIFRIKNKYGLEKQRYLNTQYIRCSFLNMEYMFHQ